jgi:hypothetical protein
MRRLLAVLALLAAPVPLVAQAIDSVGLHAHTYFLAHDLLEGRRTGTRGGDVAAAYLAAQAARLGLVGAGEDGSFFQTVPLVEATIDTAATTLTLLEEGTGGTSTTVFRTPAAFIPNAGTARTLVGVEGELAWAGSASDILARPQDLPPLNSRVAVMAGVFGSNGAAADTLRARGAVGVLQVVPNARVYALYAASRGPTRLYPDDPAAVSSFVPEIPAFLVHPSLAVRLVPPVPGDSAAAPRAFSGRRVRIALGLTRRALHARNVAALLPGTDPARQDAAVAFTAHYDHLGYSTPDARGDSLYNGFSDNAAGSAMLLAIAQALADRRPPNPTLFLWFTGEELGLLGSDWFVAHPTRPLGTVAAVINLDAGAPPAAPTAWNIQGGTRSTLGTIAADVARAAGWETLLENANPNSDHFPFLRAGVPAVFPVPAPRPFEGMTNDASQALRQRWDHYHQPADAWAPDYPFSGLVRYATFAMMIGRAAGEGPRPVMRR